MIEKPDPEKIDKEVPIEVHLGRVARELVTIKNLLSEGIRYLRDAEAEIPERIRRFTHHAHSIHDIKYMYEELGVPVPQYILIEIERLDDRLRQLLAEEYAEGGTLNRVRREMASDKENRFNHTRQIAAPTHKKETPDETRPSIALGNGINEG